MSETAVDLESRSSDEVGQMSEGSAPDERDLLRFVGWTAVIVSFFWPALYLTIRGWTAMFDDATISFRAFNVLSKSVPLLGQYSQVTLPGGHLVHDPGPLEYWLLALPVRLDPHTGQLWGAAVLCAAAGIVTIEAGRAALGTVGSIVASSFVLGSILWTPAIVADPLWNPYFGDMFFIATIACVFAALCSNRRWWVLAVFTGSVAAQAHLMFSLGSAALVLASGVFLAVEAIRGRQRLWWFVQGLELGVLCWIAPLYQELTGRPGNITLLIQSEHGQRGNGVIFGLKAFAAATLPRPVWMGGSGATALLDRIDSSSPVVAVMVGGFILAAAVLARRNRRLASLAWIVVALMICLVVTYSGIPPSQNLNLAYLSVVLYPVGAASCLAIGWAVEAGIARWMPDVAERVGSALRKVSAAALAGAGLAAVVALAVGGQLRFAPTPTETQVTVQSVERAAQKIEKARQKGVVDIRFDDPTGALQAVDYQSGVAWLLVGSGWSPRLGPFFADWPQLEAKVPTALITEGQGGTSVRWIPAGKSTGSKHRLMTDFR
jgi:hypothetical protein